MCTVTYIPQPSGWLLTSNRDEDVQRDTTHLVVDMTSEVSVGFPPDEKGGSWIAASTRQRSVCLLNGAFERHKRKLPYRHSRGKILLDAARSPRLQDFLYGLDLSGIEPFTLIFVDKSHFIELVWDSLKIHIRSLDREQTYLWSSSTLYGREVRALRKEKFDVFVEKMEVNANNMLLFHQSTPFSDPENDFIMKRTGVQTLSITQIACDKEKMSIRYLNLTNGATLISELGS